MTRRTWMLIGGAVVGAVVAAVIVAVIVVNLGGGDPVVTAGPSASAVPTASAAPSISAAPAPTPSAAPAGFLPVASLGAAEIPWDKVGPGWFLVDWAQKDSVLEVDDSGPLRVSPADASVSLLAPNGTWYAASSLSEFESDRTVSWLGETLAVFRATGPNYDYGVGNTSFFNLRTGALRLVGSGAGSPSLQGMLSDGTLRGTEYAEDSSWYVRYNDRLEPQTVCEGDSGSVAPDGLRVACLGWIASADETSDQTQVLLGAISSNTGADAIDTFRLDPYSYGIQGWLDPDTFLVLRRDPEGNAPPTYYAYNVATRKIADFALPFQATGDQVAFDWVTKTYADMAEPSASFFAADGAKLADVPCAGTWNWQGPVHSGSRVLLQCETVDAQYNPAAVTLTLVDLTTGAVTEVARAAESSSTRLRTVYPYIGSVD